MTRPNPSCGLKTLFLGIAALLLMLAPRPALAQTGLPDVQTLCEPLEIRDRTPQEAPCLQNQLKNVAKRNGDAVTLTLNNGKTKVLSNSQACQDGPDIDCVARRLVGNIADKQFITHVGVWEAGHVLLVSRRTGAETGLEDWPHLSPSKKRFVVVAASETWEIKNAIAIFSLANDPPKLEWSFPTPKEYEFYVFDGWDGDNRVLLRVLPSGPGNRDMVPTNVKLTPQGWQLKRPNGELSLGVPAVPAQANPQRGVEKR